MYVDMYPNSGGNSSNASTQIPKYLGIRVINYRMKIHQIQTDTNCEKSELSSLQIRILSFHQHRVRP